MDMVEGMLKNAKEPAWLEQYVVGEFKVWQVIFLTLAAVGVLTVSLCCCIRFRVPRTKQQIEADYQRRIITKMFRNQLERIQNSQMDTIDLKAALDLVRADFKSDSESEKEQQQSVSLMSSIVSPGSDEGSMKSTHNTLGQRQSDNNKETKKFDMSHFSSRIAALVKMSKYKQNQPSQVHC